MPSIVFTSQAEENLAKLDKSIAKRILKKIRWLVENIESVNQESLTGQACSNCGWVIIAFCTHWMKGKDRLLSASYSIGVRCISKDGR